jgi:parallel beta-helix repeat protein
MKRVLWLAPVLLALAGSAAAGGDRDDLDGSRAKLRVPAKFATIQAAIDAAQPGDSIEVGPGTYCEQVVITKSDLRVRQRDDEKGRRPILSGACGAGGYGFKVLGTAAAPVVNVEISGFIVEGFETGILLQNVVRSRVHSNEVRDNLSRPGSTTPFSQNGILLYNASFNDISRNFTHGNGHMGIGLRSRSNSVRGNRLHDNQTQYVSSCSLMIFWTSVGNQIIDNEIVDTTGAGIMIGPYGVNSQNLVARNRVYGHPDAGIVVGYAVVGSSSQPANVILENNASGNGLAGTEPDLVDYNAPPSTVLWLRNIGTCAAGNAGC